MNCKPGDLAVIIAAPYHPQHVGKIVRVTGQCPVFGLGHWDVDPPLPGNNGEPMAFDDRHLWPIRDTDGEDETLTWAGEPQEIATPTARAVEFARR